MSSVRGRIMSITNVSGTTGGGSYFTGATLSLPMPREVDWRGGPPVAPLGQSGERIQQGQSRDVENSGKKVPQACLAVHTIVY